MKIPIILIIFACCVTAIFFFMMNVSSIAFDTTRKVGLITGGTGFIGSHTVIELLDAGYNVVIVDNLINSKKEVIKRIKSITQVNTNRIIFHQGDILDEEFMENIFEKYDIDFVIHFAALKAVGESVKKPVEYYQNNLNGLTTLLTMMQRYNVWKIVFSSSATVYGLPEKVPVNEKTPTQKPTNPYGQTKAMAEQILTDWSKAHTEASVVLLRYFNPIGAHKSGLIGENPLGIPTNLMPIITKVLVGKLPELSVYGTDYETRDGTAIRDYIHVVDLAKGHVAALKWLLKNNGLEIYNLGTGNGYTVMEVIKEMEKASGKKVNYKVVGRRPGDVPAIYAECTKAEKELGWKAELTLKDMCEDSWRWQSNYPNGI